MENIIKNILKENNIEFENISRAESGFTNLVYLVDKNYVVKLSNDEKKVFKLDIETNFYKNTKLNFVPKFVASGIYQGYKYLVIEQISGQPLYKIWHILSYDVRENIVKQIANILSSFHKEDYGFLPQKRLCTSWVSKWQKTFLLNIDELKKRNFDTTKIEHFMNTKLAKIFNTPKTLALFNII